MIARLRGPVIETGKDYVVIEAGCVGYKVKVPEMTAIELKKGKEGILFTEMIVRQDAILLYGFLTASEIKVFRLLISVSRVGPQLATAILSRLRPDQIVGALLTGDYRLLATVPGVGKTGAERIVLELKKKTAELAADIGTSASQNDPRGDAILGLMALGYSHNEASSAILKMESGSFENSASGIMREALRILKEKSEENG